MDILEAIIMGLTLGAGTLLFIGPVLLFLIKSSVDGGMKAGTMVALGIIFGDIIYVAVVINGLSDYLKSDFAQVTMAIVGGILLIVLGIKPYLVRAKKEVSHLTPSRRTYFHYFLNGFIINFVNPFVITVWIGYYVLCDARLANESHTTLALVTSLLFILGTDLLKSRLSVHLKRFLTESRMEMLSKVFGVFMLLFGIRLLYVGLIA